MIEIGSATRAGFLSLLVLVAAGAARAQEASSPPDQADRLLPPVKAATPSPVADGEAYHRADEALQDPEEVRTTRALNDEIASRNQLAENQERADRAAFEEVQARAIEDRLAYEEAVRRSEAAQRQWELDRARWEADARACRAGDRTRCGPIGD